MGFSLSNLNPFTGFGLLDTGLEHVSAKDLQHRGHDFDREMWDKSTAHDIDMFNRESDFSVDQMERQFLLNQRSLQQSPASMMAGLKSAGLNPILAATGGFKADSPNVSALGASAKSSSPSRGGSPGGARSNVALASKMGELVESEVDLNSAKADAERARAGLTDSKDALLTFAKQVVELANETLKAVRESGYFGKTKENVDSLLENINMILNSSPKIEITEHTRRQLMKQRQQLKAYKGSTGGRNRKNKR